MRPNHYMLAVSLLAVAVALSQSKEQEKTHADHMEHHFDPKESAKSFDDPARDTWQLPDRVIAALNLKRGQVVADIGAGTGYFSVRLAKSGAAPKVYAADIEPSMVNYLRERAAKEGLNNVIAVQAAADQANLPEPVDLIRVVIIDFKPDSPEGPPKEFRFPPEKFKSEMGKAGYTLAKQYDFLPRQQFLIFEVAGQSSR